MATHSSILAWRIPWTEEPGRRQSLGSQRVGHSSVSNTLSCFQVLSFKNKAYLKQKEKKKVKSKRIFNKSTFPSLKKFHEFHHGAPLTQAPTLLVATTQRELGLTQETYKNALPSCCQRCQGHPSLPTLAQTIPSLFPAFAGVSGKSTDAC